MTKTIVAIGLAVLLIGCGKDKDKAGAGAGGGGDQPLELTAPALWAEYTSGRYKGMDLLERYRPGVKVSGTVKQVIGAEDSTVNFNVWLDVDGAKWVDLQFMPDEPGTAAARGKGVKVGDQASATCKIGGRTDNFMLLTSCTLH